MPDDKTIEQQATELARAHCAADPSIVAVYWFPDDKVVRIVDVDATIPKTTAKTMFHFHYAPDPDAGLPHPSDVGLIKPGEIRTLKLPKGWGTWQDARKLFV